MNERDAFLVALRIEKPAAKIGTNSTIRQLPQTLAHTIGLLFIQTVFACIVPHNWYVLIYKNKTKSKRKQNLRKQFINATHQFI